MSDLFLFTQAGFLATAFNNSKVYKYMQTDTPNTKMHNYTTLYYTSTV